VNVNGRRGTSFLYGSWSAVLLALLTGLPLLGTFFEWDFYPAEDENRRMAEFPKFGTLPLKDWPEQTEVWFQDHFGFRNTFIRRQRKMMEGVFGRTSDRALEGLNGWFYLKDNGNISDFLGLRKLSDEKMEELRVSFEGRQRWLEEQGVEYLLVIPPNKPVVYPEHLPADIQADRGADGIMQWKDYLAEKGSALNLLDLRDSLLRSKPEGTLYFPNDTHWSYLGSYFGYRAVIEGLIEWFPDLKPLPLSSCERVPLEHKGDLVAMIGGGRPAVTASINLVPEASLTNRLQVVDVHIPETNSLLEEAGSVLAVRNPDGEGKVVIFHDSFGGPGWQRFFPLHFSETVFIAVWRPTAEQLRDAVETFRPDVVINEQIHRNILHKPQPVFDEWIQALERAD
jgi:alginate O-acetyltransferase complex protein AlgJ